MRKPWSFESVELLAAGGHNLEFVDEAGPGDFVYVPPYVPHQQLNAHKMNPWKP